MRADDGGLVIHAVRGALAGAAATWVMGRVTTLLYEHEDEAARAREDEARGGETAFAAAAGKAADLAGREISEEQQQAAGSALHWGLGVGAGAAYGLLRHRVPKADWGQGAGFGLAFWLVVDEAINPVLGLTPGPGAFPWQAHARGLVGHLVFGVVAESVLDVADRVA